MLVPHPSPQSLEEAPAVVDVAGYIAARDGHTGQLLRRLGRADPTVNVADTGNHSLKQRCLLTATRQQALAGNHPVGEVTGDEKGWELLQQLYSSGWQTHTTRREMTRTGMTELTERRQHTRCVVHGLLSERPRCVSCKMLPGKEAAQSRRRVLFVKHNSEANELLLT